MTTQFANRMDMTIQEQAENRNKWVAALRSGKFQQGRHQLFNEADGTYCCLGVACVLYAGDGSVFWQSTVSTLVHHFTLPGEVREWLGCDAKGSLKDGGSLAHLNDNGYSFKQLADLIEAGELEQ